jgi:hypothetical protein
MFLISQYDQVSLTVMCHRSSIVSEKTLFTVQMFSQLLLCQWPASIQICKDSRDLRAMVGATFLRRKPLSASEVEQLDFKTSLGLAIGNFVE